MNLVSVLLDPPVLAAYLALIWLFSYRRLEIMVFLVWFIFMSWVLSILKAAIGYISSYFRYILCEKGIFQLIQTS